MNLHSLKIRRKIGDMVEVYKHLSVYDKYSLCQNFVLRDRTQRKYNLELKRNFAEDGIRGYQTISLYYRSIDTWNGLGINVVKAPSVGKFKHELTNEWINKIYKL